MFKKVGALVMALAIVISSIPVYGTNTAEAASKNEGTAELRIYSTSDLHGQSVTYSYDTASDHKNGSLAQIAGVIKDDKEDIEHGTSMLVDCGDVIFGLGAKATMSEQVSTDKQYMYELMESMNYDAITLGNHDFDYGYDYEKSILDSSGLADKVVLSNVYDAKTGKYPWATRKMIKKTVVTSKNKKKTIKIGVTGATIPQLSTFAPWKGILATKNIVDAIQDQAELLDEEGADIIVVLAHSGIGEYDQEDYSVENVGYLLTEIAPIDVICLGHTHVNFPSIDSSVDQVYEYPGVNVDNGLINGKVVVQEADHGQALGISKLKLKFVNGKVQIVNKKAEVRKITAEDEEDESIVRKNEPFDKIFRNMYEKVEVDNGVTYDNYFGMLEDNPLIQLVNDAKIAHGQKVVAQEVPEFSNCPIIASTAYNAAGTQSAYDYVKVNGTITLRDVLNLQMYAQEYSKFYYVTGAQLREMLEWQASAYEVPELASQTEWKDSNYNTFAAEGLCPILDPEWENWDGLYIFDGIEYEIDPTNLPRYNREGELMDENAHRITKLTCNGVSVNDNQKFVWVNRNLTKKAWPMIYESVKKQLLVKKTEQLTNVLAEYIEEQQSISDFRIGCDDNWKVAFPTAENYVIKSSEESIGVAINKPWYLEVLDQKDGYAYYRAKLDTTSYDNSGPFLSISELETGTSGEPVTIAVQTSDRSGISEISYLSGVHYSDDGEWNRSSKVTGGSFKAISNGVYSVKSTDSRGNSTVKFIKIDNINTELATTPKVDTVKNTKKYVTGKGSVGATVYVKTKTGVYHTEVGSNKKFSCQVEGLLADKEVKIWQVDSKGRTSEEVTVTVKRTGANKPIVDNITNKKKYITGKLNDSSYCRVLAVRGDKVYIPKGQKSKYKESNLYKKKFKKKQIVETAYSYDEDTKKFSLRVPNIYADQSFKVYSYDLISRASLVTKDKADDVAPNQPVLEDTIAQEGVVYGHVPEPKEGKTYTINVETEGVEYTGTADENGYFSVVTTCVEIDEDVSVTACDTDDYGQERESLARDVKAESCFDVFGKEGSTSAYLEYLDNKSESLLGFAEPGNPEEEYTSLIIDNRKINFETNEEGDFEYVFEKKKAAGTKIGLLIRYHDGSVKAYAETKVDLAIPDAPEFFMDEKITEDTKRIKIGGVDDANAVLLVGRYTYKPIKKKKVEKDGEDYYYYIFKPDILRKGAKVRAYLKNASGSSKKTQYGFVKKGKKKDKKNKKNKKNKKDE
ncbi:MAG: 5'-nucleotidase C-terminal domain-containing protein [Lachnospiraceae bacterium]|nr:5'-nucleotidase C-terminal domain-containing protein [Lachnospiraceae bacterium]